MPSLFLHQVLAGFATGSIYACLALAIVMIYQTINHLNFAQGEMAMFSTFIAWQLMQWGVPYWVAFAATVAFSFLAGVAIERVLFRPLRNAPVLSHVVVFIALFAILNSLAGFIWDYNVKSFPTPFGSRSLFGNGLMSSHDAGVMGVTLATGLSLKAAGVPYPGMIASAVFTAVLVPGGQALTRYHTALLVRRPGGRG